MSINMKDLSNTELLAVLVGPGLAKNLAHRQLSEVFGFRPPRQQELSLGEELAVYVVHPTISAAKELITRCMQEELQACVDMNSPAAVKTFLCAKIGHQEYESFWCLWLDAQNRLIAADELFRGTLTQTSVYPREVAALAGNASSVIFAHNHPSGVETQSRADELLTNALKTALALIDVRVLDHIVVAGTSCTSFAEKGLI